MNKNTRVRHVTSGFKMTCGDVEEGIAACALAWVTRGETFRTLTEEEAIAARNVRAARLEPFPLAELRGLMVTGLLNLRNERAIARQGTEFAFACAGACQ